MRGVVSSTSKTNLRYHPNGVSYAQKGIRSNPDVPVALVHDVLLVEVDGNLLNTLVVYVER